jgi:transcriptional regulator with GAF, ATPase, and Fis domain
MSRHPHALAVLARLDEFVAATARSRSADERDLPALLCSLVEGAVDAVPGADAAGVLEMSPRGVFSRHVTDAVIEELDLLARDHGEGPVVAAAGHATSPAAAVTALDTDAEYRWPRWTSRARSAGIAATLTVALPVTAGKRPTVMSFYSRRSDGFDETSTEAAQIFAAPVTVALQAIDRTESLQRAVASRDVIGQAKGLLMERHALSADEAFTRLVRCSQETNVRLADVAAWLVHEGTRGADHERRRPPARPVPGPPRPLSVREVG